MGQGQMYTLRDNTTLTYRGSVYSCGSMRCQSLTSGSTQQRALCPWKTILNFDPNRIPMVISEAYCSCSYCFEFGTSRCESVMALIKVLRQNQTNFCEATGGQPSYTESWERVSIGCTCAVVKRF